MKAYIKKATALLLALSVFVSLVGCSGNKTIQTHKSTSSAAANEADNSHPIVEGSFIQSWLTVNWTDERWQQELKIMKDAGMKYLILGDTATRNKTTRKWYSYFPSTISDVKAGYCGTNVIENALRNCKKAGFKVFVGMGLDDKWWDVTVNDPTWFNSFMTDSSKIITDLYNMYYSKYQGTFYGWYWPPEMYNDDQAKVSSPNRMKRIMVLANGLNIAIDTINKLNPNLPIMLSPYVNHSITTSDDNYHYWKDVLQNCHFRSIDIMAPQDGVAGGGQERLAVLDEWWASFKKACDAKGMQFWDNAEDFYVTYGEISGGNDLTTPANVDRFIKQLKIANKYCSHIITFAYPHYYSPNNVIKGFNTTYLQYVKDGKIETTPPSAPKNIKATVSDGTCTLSWDPSTDNVEVAGYIIYRFGGYCGRTGCSIVDNKNVESEVDTSFTDYKAATNAVGKEIKYQVAAYDCAGNLSAKTAITVTVK